MRFILLIIIIVTFPFFGGRYRYRRWGRMYGPDYYSNRSRRFTFSSYEREYDNPPTIADPLDFGGPARSFMRRKNALKECAPYLTKSKNILNLKNKQVALMYDTRKEIMNLIDLNDLSRSATIYWNEQTESILRATDNKFARTFDEICFSFNERANYPGMLKVLQERFTVIHILDSKANELVYKEQNEILKSNDKIQQQEQLTEPIKKIDINSATEDEIAKLPGINVVVAKKIIKYRDEKDGFKTIEEFFSVMKIKKHFQDQLKSCVDVLPIKKAKKLKNTERIIDF